MRDIVKAIGTMLGTFAILAAFAILLYAVASPYTAG